MGEIAERIGLATPSVSLAIKKLERQGLCLRNDHDEDGRASRLYLSPKGIEELRLVQSYREARIIRLLGGLDSDDLDSLNAILARLLLQGDDDGTGKPNEAGKKNS